MKEQTKIIIATGIFPPSIGGPASYSKLLKDRLPELGFDVTVVSFDTVRKYPKGISHILYFAILLWKSVSAKIIYAQDPVSVGLPAMVVSKILFKKFLLKIVGDFAWEQGSSRFNIKSSLDEFVVEKQKNSYVRILQFVEKLVAKNAKKIIVPSNYLKSIVAKWGIDSEKIIVIYNAFNPPKSVEKRLEKKSDYFKVISVGRLVPWKGFPQVISSVKSLNKEEVKIALEIAGSGPEEKNLKELIGDDKNIKLLGGLPQTELHKKIAESDLFVLYTGYEGFSHQLLEVMALDVPIITTAVGGNVEIIEDGKNGVLVSGRDVDELTEAIRNLLNDSEKMNRLKNNAKESLLNYSENRMLGNLNSVIKSLL